jgi:haloacetate dehalogenase
MMAAMFEKFSQSDIDIGAGCIRILTAGDGPPLLLLHGYPQSHVMWHKIAHRLAENFTVVATDLRGYGDSFKPPSGDDHEAYSFRAMAADQVAVMGALGHDAFFVAGHDRGARVSHRMALDHPRAVKAMALLDIVPTHTLYRNINQTLATGYYHWFFLIQPFDFPERMIGADPEYYIRRIGGAARSEDCFTGEAMAEYIRCFSDPGTIHATCEDYRAAAGIDLAHDEADIDRKVACPALILWSAAGLMGKNFDMLQVWQEKCEEVSGRGLDCSHFLPEDAPGETYQELKAFFKI